MKIVFFGSDNFAVPSLEALLSYGYEVLCVVTQPDRKKGRGLHLEGTAVKVFARERGLVLLQPRNINTSTAVSHLKKLNPDLFVVIAYGQILSKQVLSIPKLFAMNIHASLLPNYRGAAPINWVIIEGEKVTGVTAMKMTEGMDAGPVILQEKMDIDEHDTAVTLNGKLAQLGAALLIKALRQIEKGGHKFTPQDEKKISFAQKLQKHNGLINWAKTATEIHNLIKGLYEWPGAFTHYQGKLLKIYKAEVFLSVEKEGIKVTPGEVIKVLKDQLIVSCGKGDLIIEELQIEGKRRMQVKEFIAGHKISVGDILG